MPGRPPKPDHDFKPGQPERLQKILAHAGLGSRRECEEYILQGRVTVDGKVANELGTRVDPEASSIAVDGEKIRLERMVYYAVNKPKGYVSTNDDPAGRPRVIDLLPEVPERVYSVGRLDEDSTGLMILTNDGQLANRLAHPRYGVEKVYRALVAGTPGREVLDRLVEGIWLSDGKVRAKRARLAGTQGEASTIELVLAEGKKREIRRMLAKLGHKVMNLTRVAIGPIVLKGLASGEHRPLTKTEVELLRKVAAGFQVPSPRISEGAGDRKMPRPPRRPEGPSEGGRSQRQGRSGPFPAAGKPMPGKPMPGRPAASDDAAPRRPGPGKPMPGKPMPGSPAARGPRPDRPVPGKPMPGRPMPGRPTSEKSITGEPAPRSPFSGGRVPSKPMPGGDRPTPPGGKRMPGKPPMPGAQAPGARKPMPGVGSKFDTPDLPTSPGVEKAKRMVDKASEPGKVGRRILGLDPKVASEAGFSLAGRPAIKRPPAKKRPLRRATGVKRVRKEENDG